MPTTASICGNRTSGNCRQLGEVNTSSSIFSASDSRVHFGLAAATTADIEVRWPGGRVQTFKGVAANRLVDIDEEHGIVR